MEREIQLYTVTSIPFFFFKQKEKKNLYTSIIRINSKKLASFWFFFHQKKKNFSRLNGINYNFNWKIINLNRSDTTEDVTI